MTFTPEQPGPDYDRLKTSLVNSKLQTQNPAAFQTILGLIDGVQKFQKLTTDELNRIIAAIQFNEDGSISISGFTNEIVMTGTPDYITADGLTITRYLVNVATDISGDLPFSNLVQATGDSKLVGRGDSFAGDFEEISLDSTLEMIGTTLGVSSSITGSYVPMVTGDEPPVLMSDGLGNLLLVPYTP